MRIDVLRLGKVNSVFNDVKFIPHYSPNSYSNSIAASIVLIQSMFSDKTLHAVVADSSDLHTDIDDT